LVLLGHSAQATKIIVGAGEALKSIREAIEAAAPSDTVIVKQGVYREGNIVISKPIVLIGESLPVIDGEAKYENFTVRTHHVHIEGFKIINSGVSSMNDLAGVGAEDSNHLIIRNNKFNNTYFAMHLSNSNFSIVENNQLNGDLRAEHQTGNGIHLWKCSNGRIIGNEVSRHRDGIYFEFVTHTLIQSNTCSQNLRYGLHFMFSHDDEYRNNKFIDNGAGVAVMYTKGVKMIDNVFQHNWGSAAYGLLLKDIRDSYVTGNMFVENSVAIAMEGSSRIEFNENVFSNNGYAVRLQASCDDNTFERNNFTGNTFDMVTNGTLVLNTIKGNYWDKYEGYDLDRDNIGDVPYRPVSMYGVIIERMPTAVLLWRSFLVFLLDRVEKAVPAITPENLKDDSPSMKPHDLV
jgi:nitrous oxidase accessory protein